MPRKNRRDCRKSQSKNNPMNKRVEELQKQIRKAKKQGPEAAAAVVAELKEAHGNAADAPDVALTSTAASFLSQMRAEVTSDLHAAEKTRAKEKNT